jgi:hypothetical protein
MKLTITIPAEILNSNRVVSFAFGEPDANGQLWAGTTKGREQVGEHIRVRRQIGASEHEYSRVEVIERECPVTGDVVLTLRAEGRCSTTGRLVKHPRRNVREALGMEGAE